MNGFVEACVLLAFGASFLIGGPVVDHVGPRSAYAIGADAAVIALFVMAPAVRALTRARASAGVPEPTCKAAPILRP